MFAIRIEEMVCQNLRAWQEGTGGEVMQCGSVGGRKQKHRHNRIENSTGNKISLIWNK